MKRYIGVDQVISVPPISCLKLLLEHFLSPRLAKWHAVNNLSSELVVGLE